MNSSLHRAAQKNFCNAWTSESRLLRLRLSLHNKAAKLWTARAPIHTSTLWSCSVARGMTFLGVSEVSRMNPKYLKWYIHALQCSIFPLHAECECASSSLLAHVVINCMWIHSFTHCYTLSTVCCCLAHLSQHSAKNEAALLISIQLCDPILSGDCIDNVEISRCDLASACTDIVRVWLQGNNSCKLVIDHNDMTYSKQTVVSSDCDWVSTDRRVPTSTPTDMTFATALLILTMQGLSQCFMWWVCQFTSVRSEFVV